MFNKDDDVQSANYLTTSCACMQCGLFSTQFHAAFLSSYKAVYNIPSHHDLYETEIRQEPDFEKEGIEEKKNAQIINNEDEELIDATDEEENIITQASDKNDIVIPDIDLADLCNFDFGIHQSDISGEYFHDSSPRDVQEIGINTLILLHFKGSSGLSHNVKIVDGHIIISNPKAKQIDVSEYQAVWDLSHKTGDPILKLMARYQIL
ncbi:uncharacterized protein EV420DRAFT_1687073 [Desarmillaria tabescens]|uniref:Uncharacterized protein n=1 Tax=Armillaria tabescens TaxID=1929756 RepID=A0AA39KAK7_ARMTA|nr:uncharacterized protein EV420DRAFT_1687073 [Desarmillaria tabescens]KAK0457627.1 hypothetical protein EV420DRAFT_1687073 [Desarmillaria tabescens]